MQEKLPSIKSQRDNGHHYNRRVSLGIISVMYCHVGKLVPWNLNARAVHRQKIKLNSSQKYIFSGAGTDKRQLQSNSHRNNTDDASWNSKMKSTAPASVSFAIFGPRRRAHNIEIHLIFHTKEELACGVRQEQTAVCQKADILTRNWYCCAPLSSRHHYKI